MKDVVDCGCLSGTAVAEVDPQVAAAGHRGKVAILSAWHTRLPVALQKGNAACPLQAGKVRSEADPWGAVDGKATSKTCCGTRRLRPALVVSSCKEEVASSARE